MYFCRHHNVSNNSAYSVIMTKMMIFFNWRLAAESEPRSQSKVLSEFEPKFKKMGTSKPRHPALWGLTMNRPVTFFCWLYLKPTGFSAKPHRNHQPLQLGNKTQPEKKSCRNLDLFSFRDPQLWRPSFGAESSSWMRIEAQCGWPVARSLTRAG